MAAPEHIDANPQTYARRLASYIRDPSTIRARTLDMFGRGPTVEEARQLRAEIEAERERDSWFNAYMSPRWDGHQQIDFAHQPAPSKAPAFQFVPRDHGAEWRSSWRELIRAVAADFELTVDDILGPCRLQRIVHVRQLIAYLMRERGASFPQIGRRMNRDGSTIQHSCAVCATLLQRNPAIAAAYRRYTLEVPS